MIEIVNPPYFLRDLLILTMVGAIIIVLTRIKGSVRRNIASKEFITAFYLLVLAFVLIFLAQIIGVLVRASILFYNRYPYLDLRAVLLTGGALCLFVSSLMVYIPFAKGKYKVIKITTEPEANFKYGAYYGSPEECHTAFVQLAKKIKIPCIAIARDPPEVFRRKLGLKIIPVLWISKVEHEDAIHPTRLAYLLENLKSFLESADIDKAVLIDGIEYLILENGEKAVIKFLTKLKDIAILNRGIIIIPADKSAIGEKVYSLLTSEFNHVETLLAEIGGK
ncbi:DUF835 domain-containing protein [Thermococcus barophilus]|uniref:DUF835 domain-containing protein n=1 Tax=Thermococcus barophilus TaxID=55802 RepID=A0A0S1XDI1_THEBA|nr:DUF835 domain-containing protein [Thermococcus barophilus]ALM75860.1 conserved membrane hypothetical protein [Thermococcus barophilus]